MLHCANILDKLSAQRPPSSQQAEGWSWMHFDATKLYQTLSQIHPVCPLSPIISGKIVYFASYCWFIFSLLMVVTWLLYNWYYTHNPPIVWFTHIAFKLQTWLKHSELFLGLHFRVDNIITCWRWNTLSYSLPRLDLIVCFSLSLLSHLTILASRVSLWNMALTSRSLSSRDSLLPCPV